MAEQNGMIWTRAKMREYPKVSLRLGLRDADRANEILPPKMRRAAKCHQASALGERPDRERIQIDI